MHILLTGAEGQLCAELRRCLSSMPWRVHATSHHELDIANARQIEEIFSGEFDLVVNAAAYTAVDRAEAEEAAAFRVNAEGPCRLAAACARQGAALIHVSTDYVFDGMKPAPYCESDTPCPANIYGRSKEAGERAVRDALDKHIILRTAWLFGARGRNFVKTILRLAAERDQLDVVADQWGNPTAASDLAQCIAELVRVIEVRSEGTSWGTYHGVNQEAVSWHGFAETIVSLAAPVLRRCPAVRPIATVEYPTPAVRPLNSRLDCSKLQRTFGIAMPSWRQTLPSVIGQILTLQEQETPRGVR